MFIYVILMVLFIILETW